MQAQTQLENNRKLEEGLRIIKVDREKIGTFKNILVPDNPTIDDFISIIKNYQDVKQEFERKSEMVRRYRESLKKNDENRRKN
jgi:hypothetical protein